MEKMIYPFVCYHIFQMHSIGNEMTANYLASKLRYPHHHKAKRLYFMIVPSFT